MARFGVKEVADCTFFNLVTGEPELYLDTLKLSNLENNAESTYATGGKGSSRLVGWDYGRTSTFNIQDALLNPKALSMQLGTELEEKIETIKAREVLVATLDTATNTYKIKVSELIKANASNAEGVVVPFIFLTDETGKAQLAKIDATSPTATYGTATVGTYTVSEITIMDTAFATAGIATGAVTVPVIVYYDFETIDNAEVITVSSDKYAGYYKVVGDTLWRNEATGQDEKVQLVIPKAKITSTFTMTMQPDGDPSVFDFNLDVFKDSTSTDMVKMIRYKSNYEA